MKKLFLIAAVLLTGCCGRSDVSLDLIPAPRQVERSCGEYRLPERLTVACGDSLLLAARDFLAHALPGTEFAAPALGDEGDVVLALDRSLGEGAYRLRVASDGVRIAAGNYGGAISAIATLRQLAAAGGGATVPAVEIEDVPRYAWRGCMLDVARHFFTKEQVKALLLRMAEYKFNKFHWHLTDDQGWRIEIRRYPELTRVGSVRRRTLIGKDPGGEYDESCRYDETPYGGYYTQEQIREVVDYAARRFITVIPEIEFPGHAVAALASYPWLSCTGERYEVRQTWDIDDRVFCPGRESTFEFIEGVLSEVLELFPSEYIHIGGDECPTKMWARCGHCQARMRAEGIDDLRGLQGYATARVERFLQAHGRQLIGWDEILESGVTPTAVVMSWRGTEGGVRAARQGNRVVMSPSTYCYFDYYQTEDTASEPLAWGGCLPLEKVYAFDPYEGLDERERACVLGVQANLWTEYIPDFGQAQYMLLPRLSALAEVGWSLDRKDPADYRRRLARLARCYDAAGFRYARHGFGE